MDIKKLIRCKTNMLTLSYTLKGSLLNGYISSNDLTQGNIYLCKIILNKNSSVLVDSIYSPEKRAFVDPWHHEIKFKYFQDSNTLLLRSSGPDARFDYDMKYSDDILVVVKMNCPGLSDVEIGRRWKLSNASYSIRFHNEH